MRHSGKKIEEPIVVIQSTYHLCRFWDENKNAALELMKNISSNDVYSVKGRTIEGARVIETPSDIYEVGDILTKRNWWDLYGPTDMTSDGYEKFVLKAFPVWAKSARRFFSLVDKLNKED